MNMSADRYLRSYNTKFPPQFEIIGMQFNNSSPHSYNTIQYCANDHHHVNLKFHYITLFKFFLEINKTVVFTITLDPIQP